MNLSPAEIEALVRQVVTRILGETAAIPPPNTAHTPHPVLDAATLQNWPENSIYPLQPHTLVTPLARDVALQRHIRLADPTATPVTRSGSGAQTIAIGADHGGFALKNELKAMLTSPDFGYTVLDCGAHSTDSVDYPDFAYAVAQHVARGTAWRGIAIDGAGIGSCMAANKVPGVRAAMCYDQATAVNSREHNNANVLTLGAGLIGPNLARQIVRSWLDTPFGGGRHGRRVDKIMAIEKRFSP